MRRQKATSPLAPLKGGRTRSLFQEEIDTADGNGSYTVKVLERTSSDKYGTVVDATFKASLSNEFAPFIRPNLYVNYSSSVSPKAIAEAQNLVGGETDPLKYDESKAKTVQSGYLPVLAEKKGICFDCAALMAGMLRSQGV